ncbi:MAG: aspartate aminotransferase family protein [Leptospiraceae bacterium]|nr:aspartate aminotransferase family protein [Leptospiraceae bacterium]
MKEQITKSLFLEIKERSDKYILGNYKRYEIAFEYGSGDLLYDLNGKEYIDFQSGIAVTNLGHGEADIIESLRDQADKLIHTSNLFYSKEQSLLAEAIIVNSFPGKVFLCNSGTEANEAAFKLARKFALSKKIESPVILSLKGSFHGRTSAAMMLTGQEKVRNGFGPMIPGFDYIEENNIQSLESKFKEHKGKIAALILEPVLGEFGALPLTDEFLLSSRKITAEEGAMFILDEIQTGMGRTGKLFCYQHYPFYPDAMTLAKGLGSGFPIGALVVGEKFTEYLTQGSHGSTFGGNHLAAVVAYETLKVILGRELLVNLPPLSEFLFRRLRILQAKFPSIIKEVRGRGLHIGLELNVLSRPIVEKCLEKGLIINSTNETMIRIMPPLTVSIERIDDAMNIFESVLFEYST